MSDKSSANRWIPFQCPACFGLFRLRRHQIGLTGRCPNCAAAVGTAERSTVAGVDPTEALDVSKRALLGKMAVAEEMTPEEMEQQEAAMRNRKRRYVAGEKSTGWEDDENHGAGGRISWKAWLSWVMALVVISALGIRYIITPKDDGPPGSELVLGEGYDELFKEVEIKSGGEIKSEEDEVSDLVDRYSSYDLDKLEESVKGFLTAETVEEKKRYVRQPERVGPLMDDHYAKVGYEPKGFETINRHEVTYRKNLVLTTVQTADFLDSGISVERLMVDGEEIYLVDWESWAGYSELLPEEMREKKPTTPFLVRAKVKPADYYNYGFNDDQKWNCYGLEMGEQRYAFLGYVPRESELDKRLSAVQGMSRPEPFLLKVAYPPDARAKDQVEIVEIVPADGWVFLTPDDEGDGSNE